MPRSDLAKGEHGRFDSSLEERDLEGALIGVSGPADELIEAPVCSDALAAIIDVD